MFVTIRVYDQVPHDAWSDYLSVFLPSGSALPSNLSAVNITSSSFVLQWSSYTAGNATLLAYRVLVLNQGRRDNRWTAMDGQVYHLTTAGNALVLEIKNLASFNKYCVRIGLIREEGIGELSDCFYVYTKGENLVDFLEHWPFLYYRRIMRLDV